MSWFLFALICVIGWGCADLFYKKSSDGSDDLSHLKIAVWVGLVMGVTALCLLPFAESVFSFSLLVKSAVRYAPASLAYIVSMVVGYAGMRYLEISIVSPIQNASGAFSSLGMLIFFSLRGKFGSLSENFSLLDLFGVLFIVAGMVAIAVVEQKLSRGEQGLPAEEKKYRFGALALLFPLIYCLFDTVGTAADGIILDGETGLGLGEIDVLVLYGLTFALFGLGAWVYMAVVKDVFYNPFRKSERSKGIASVCEEFGQTFYVYAMAKNPVLAAPMVASYCILSVLLSRVFLGEKLKKAQYACVAAVIVGIVLLGISEGLGEL